MPFMMVGFKDGPGEVSALVVAVCAAMRHRDATRRDAARACLAKMGAAGVRGRVSIVFATCVKQGCASSPTP